MKNMFKKLMLATMIAYASLFAMVSPALAQIPEDSSIEVTISDDEALVVYNNTTDVENFTLDSTNEDEIITLLAQQLDATEEEIEDVITFIDETGGQNQNIEDIEIEVIINEDEGSSDVSVMENGTQTESFTVESDDEDAIISEVASTLGFTEEEVESVISFIDETDGQNQSIEDIEIEVIVNEDEGSSDVSVMENGTQTESFTVESDDEDTIISEVASTLGFTEEEIESVITFDFEDEQNGIGGDGNQNTSIENLEITIMINENNNITEVNVFENSTEVSSFTINSVETNVIINELSQRFDASEDEVVDAIVLEVEVETTVGEWSLFVFFDRFVQLFNTIENNIYGDSPLSTPEMSSSPGRVLSEDVDYSDVNSTIQVAVDYEKWTMFKVFRMMASPNGLLIGTQMEEITLNNQ